MSDSNGTLKPPLAVNNSLQLPTNSNSTLPLPISAPQQLSNKNILSSSSSGSATGNPRNKCALKPGHSLMDWIRLGNTPGVDLAGTRGRVIPVSMEELARHNTREDAWMAIRGKVFNVTRYMDFHPGGVDELMRGVGIDATKLFEEVHAWVNYPQLLGKCYIGPLKATIVSNTVNQLNTTNDFKPPLSLTQSEIIPRFDWIQKRNELTIYIYTRQFANPGCIVQQKTDTTLKLFVQIVQVWHEYEFELQHAVQWPPRTLQIGPETGKIELILTKVESIPWQTYGAHKTIKMQEFTIEDLKYDFVVVKKYNFNHDSFELCLESAQKNIIFILPIGYHLNIETPVNGEIINRSYTPVHAQYLSSTQETITNSYQLNFLIKFYGNGQLTAHLNTLESGAVLQISTPRGNFKLQTLAKHRNILFLAAGSGITPFLNAIGPLLKRNTNRLESLHLLYYNKTTKDIWAQKKLTSIAEADERFCYTNILSQPDDSWTGATGRLSKVQLTSLLHKESIDITFIAICGPNAFNDLALDLLKELNFIMKNIHVFQS